MPQENQGAASVASRLAEAERCLGTGDIARGVELLRSVLRTESDNASALHMLGAVALHAGDLASAQQLLERAVRKDPDEFAYRITYGNVLLDRGELGPAMAQFDRATQLDPGHVLGWYNLGNALQGDGQIDAAIEAFRRAVEVDASHVDARNNLGAALQDLGRREEAAHCFRDLLRDQPHYASALFNLHTVIFDDRDLGPARAALEELVRYEPGHGLGYFHLAVVLDIQGDPGARSMFERLRGSTEAAPYLDSWEYVRSVRKDDTRFFGTKFELLQYAMEQAKGEGLVCEFGVRHGTSIRWIAAQTRGTVHGFDSFEGLPDRWGDNPAGIYTTRGALPSVPGNVTLHAGLFADTLPEFKRQYQGSLRFANIDCDIYGSTRTIFDKLSERVERGTVLVFDEYLMNPTWRDDEHKAFIEAADANGWRHEYIAIGPVSKQAAVRIL